MTAILIAAFQGFQPRTLGYFLLVQKVTKNTHRGGTLSMGSLPYEPHPRDDTKGACPLWKPPQEKRLVLVGDAYSRGCA